MFNLNIPPTSLLGIEGSGLCTTPKTPEIVNSLIAMTTNPLDNYNFNNMPANVAANAAQLANVNNASTAQLLSQDSNHSSSSATPLDSPAGTTTTPSVQQTCSQLIKAGLKLSIQSKRKISSCDSSSGSEQTNSKCSRRDEDCDDSTDDDSEHKSIPKGLTPEDEDRRRRRRERNKIAATKCRMKKRERTQNLIKESEQLDTQNVDLKNQVRALESERRKLLDMLQSHAHNCEQRGGFQLPEKLLTSPAYKYLADLELESSSSSNYNVGVTKTNHQSSQAANKMCENLEQQLSSPPRTVIPPMSTIFSRSNNFKNVQSVPISNHNLPNGYCKPSPTSQELGYLSSPSQESICLPSLQHSPTAANNIGAHQLTDYIPNCNGDNTLTTLGANVSLSHTHTVNSTPSHAAMNDSSSVLLSGSISSPLSVLNATPTNATEFVKNELVDSQSPYTTAASAERFLFENSFMDIKHAINMHPNNLHANNNNNHHHQNHNHNNLHCNNHNNNNNNNNTLLDFTTNGLLPFHEQISMKNDYLHEAELFAQLTGDAAEFVDLDTGISASFSMTNGGCLA